MITQGISHQQTPSLFYILFLFIKIKMIYGISKNTATSQAQYVKQRIITDFNTVF